MENNVKYYRLLSGLSQSELGQKCGLSQNSISSIERGEFNPMLITANDIANALDVSIFELFYLEGHAEQFYY